MNCATPSSVTGGITQSASDLSRSLAFSTQTPSPAQVEQVAVVLAVAERDALLGGEAEALAEERERGRLRDVRGRELEEDRERLGDERAVAEARLHLVAQRIEPRLDADGDELRRRPGEPAREVADDVHLDPGDLGVADRLGVRLGDVQLVVDVGVRRARVWPERVQDLDGQIDLERRVQQHLTGVGVGDQATLVADDRRVHVELVRDPARALEHASRWRGSRGCRSPPRRASRRSSARTA